MFSSVKVSRDSDADAGDDDDPSPVSVLVAASRPLIHTRSPPLPPIPFPTMSLHVDRHKVVAALSSSGAELDVLHVPEFTRNAVGTAVDERGAGQISESLPRCFPALSLIEQQNTCSAQLTSTTHAPQVRLRT